MNLKTWTHGLAATFINGAASGIVLALAEPEHFNLHDGLQKLLATSALLGMLAAANYLKKSPLPDSLFTFALALLSVPVFVLALSAQSTLQAPNKQLVVQAVIDAHPDINSCDEDSPTQGRALLVDWAAQRLNAQDGTRRWGRKSRGKPNGDTAVNPNTDGLTFLRSDGLFEIYDVVIGAAPCGSSWEGHGPFKQGENGYWAPPQLGPEPKEGGGGPPQTCAACESALVSTRIEVAQLRDAHSVATNRIAQLEQIERELRALNAELLREHDTLQQQLTATRQERDALKARPAPRCTFDWRRFACVAR